MTQSVISNNAEEATFEGLTLLAKLVENKVKNPEEAKYNRFKRTNAKVASKILSLQGGINDLIQSMGFSVTADDHYEFTGDMRTLKLGFKALNNGLEPMRVAKMTPEERTKHLLIKEQRAAAVAQRAEEAARREELLRLQEANRREKAMEPVKSSQANKLNFGAQTVVFKPPASG